jgi:hypothetical protein
VDDREPGFILYHRRLYSSPVWRSLTKGQRWVLLSVLVLANFRRKPLGYFGGELVWVERGELAHEVEKIAAHAEESYATARKAIEKMLAFGLLEVRWNYGANNRVRILRVVNYERYQGVAQQANNESDNDHATEIGAAQETGGIPSDEPRNKSSSNGGVFGAERATGHATTAQQANNEPRKERTREQGEQEKRVPASAPLPLAAAVQMRWPAASALHGLLAEKYPALTFARGSPAETLETACGQNGTAAVAVALVAFAERKGETPGSTAWFAKVLPDALKTGAKAQEQPRGRKAMGVVGSNWEEPGF